MDDADDLRWLSADAITTAIRLQSGDAHASISSWTHARLAGAGEGIGVWRITGDGLVRGEACHWSIVLKGWKAPATDAELTSFNWPNREPELYSSGLLADLPGGIRAPACFGTMQRGDGSTWVWLEDITRDFSGPQSLDDYACVARSLGQFNGAYLDGVPLPEHPGLSQRWTRQWVEAVGPSLDVLAREANRPLVWQVYPPSVSEPYMRLWANRKALYRRLERMPRTFCHLDAFQRNAFLRRGGSPRDEVVLIDWAFSGIGHLGEDITPLVVASVIFMELPFEAIDQLSDTVQDAYIEGLRDAGWKGDPGEVHEAYLLSAALRNGVGAIRNLMLILLDIWPQTAIENLLGRPFDEIAANLASIQAWLAGTIRKHPEIFA